MQKWKTFYVAVTNYTIMKYVLQKLEVKLSLFMP